MHVFQQDGDDADIAAGQFLPVVKVFFVAVKESLYAKCGRNGRVDHTMGVNSVVEIYVKTAYNREVRDYIDGLDDQRRKAECESLLEIFACATSLQARPARRDSRQASISPAVPNSHGCRYREVSE